MKHFLATATFAVTGLFVSASDSAIIDLGNITRDTTTGLDWLDVTETVGLSYSQVTAQLDTGGDYEGWRYATYSELDQLIISFGYVKITESCPHSEIHCDENLTGELFAVEEMIKTLGDTQDHYFDSNNSSEDVSNMGAGYTAGLLATTAQDAELQDIGFIVDSELVYRDSLDPYINFHDSVQSLSGTGSRYVGRLNTGSFLVQPSAIPIPATIWFFGSAILGLGGLRKIVS